MLEKCENAPQLSLFAAILTDGLLARFQLKMDSIYEDKNDIITNLVNQKKGGKPEGEHIFFAFYFPMKISLLEVKMTGSFTPISVCSISDWLFMMFYFPGHTSCAVLEFVIY